MLVSGSVTNHFHSSNPGNQPQIEQCKKTPGWFRVFQGDEILSSHMGIRTYVHE